MRKILVTGGLGYIGSHCVVSLVVNGYEPIILDNLENSESFILDNLKNICGRDLTFYEADCSDEEFLTRVCLQQNIEGVIHFAAYKAVGESVENPLKYYKNNIDSLISVLTAMRNSGFDKLVFSSSCTVYGQPGSLPVDETEQIKNAMSPYGNTKIICEDILKDVYEGFEEFKGISLRYFNPIGAHTSGEIGELPLGKPNNLVPFITQSAIGKRGPITINGNDYDTPDGTCIRDYIHVIDLAEAHISALNHLFSQKNKKYYDYFNVGIGAGKSVKEVIDAFETSTGVSLDYNFGPRRPGDVEKIYANPKKTFNTLNWRPEFTINDALSHAWKWELKLKENFHKWKKS